MLGRIAAAVALAAATALATTATASSAGGAGGVLHFGSAAALGAPPESDLVGPITGIAADPDGHGYWLVAADGGVFSYGGARFYGSLGARHFVQPVVGMAPTTTGHGYWLASDTGAVEAFGDAGTASRGAYSGPFVAPIVGIAAAPTGHGYWLVAADGGVFSYGGARFYGSLSTRHLAAPVVGVAATPTGHGYWLVAADGGVFSFGGARFSGSTGRHPPSAPVVGVAATPTGQGYWVATAVTLPLGHGRGRATRVVTGCDEDGAPLSERPARIVLACADYNSYLSALTWTTWTRSRARATGEYTENTCTPACVDGTFVTTRATVTLADPLETVSGPEFAQITYTFVTRSGPVTRREVLLLSSP